MLSKLRGLEIGKTRINNPRLLSHVLVNTGTILLLATDSSGSSSFFGLWSASHRLDLTFDGSFLFCATRIDFFLTIRHSDNHKSQKETLLVEFLQPGVPKWNFYNNRFDRIERINSFFIFSSKIKI